MTVLHLHQNMRLNTLIEEEQKFAKWQLEVGKGMHTDEGGNLTLPEHFKCRENTVDSLIDTIYPNIHAGNLSGQYFSERSILSSKNDDVDTLNAVVLEKLPGQVQEF